MKNYFYLIMILLMCGCGTKTEYVVGSKGDKGDQGASAPVSVVSDEQADINDLLNDENVYRDGLGQTLLSEGLGCTLYTFTSGDRIQATSGGHTTLTGLSQVATYLFKSEFNQPDSPASDGNNALPSALRSAYLNLFLIRCQGQLVVRETGYYSFELSSDDASLLYLDGAKVIDNDNAHGVTVVTAFKYLRRGVHVFRLDYAQSGGGNQALVLKANGSLIGSQYYFH